MVLLLLRHGANPRILSTTREPFSALELALFAELSRDCLSQLCAHWLKAGKGDNAMSSNQQSLGVDGRAEQLGNYKREDQQLASIGRGALTPARIRRVFESIGKNLMGLATEDIGSSLGWPDLMGSSETRPSMESGKSRLECLAECTLLEGPARFVLAEHILRHYSGNAMEIKNLSPGEMLDHQRGQSEVRATHSCSWHDKWPLWV